MNLLVTKAKKHDKDAFSKLIEQQEKAMYQMAKSILRNEHVIKGNTNVPLHKINKIIFAF